MTKSWIDLKVIAHRCGGALAPENSLAGLAVAARLGLGAVEFDVMLSADGVPVVIHDETLERTTTGSGRVAEARYSELQRLTCGKGWQGFEQEPIPRLQDVLRHCHALNLLPNIEIKPSFGHELLTGRVVAEQALNEWRALGGQSKEVLLSSFSAVALVEAKRVAPSLSRAMLFERIPDDWFEQLSAVAAVAVHCAADELGVPMIAKLSALGIPLRCYTVNDPVQATRLFDQGVQAVFTDALQEFTSLA